MDTIVSKKATLLVVDVQNDYCHEEGALGRMGRDTSAAQKMIPTLQMTIEFARENDIPIISFKPFMKTVRIRFHGNNE
jgi:ureidoacrylate peracid hydrolase